LNLLEDFNPQRTDDPFRWIPQGLFYDLNDDRNDFNAVPQRVPITDNFNGYNNQLFFNALHADITNLPAYRTRLINENPGIPSSGVTEIFTFYGY
jgi:hypothetical protein